MYFLIHNSLKLQIKRVPRLLYPGYLSAGRKPLTGNYGLMDQEAALRWTRDNIAKFRGHRDKVTVAGHSVGGASVGILMNMPRATS